MDLVSPRTNEVICHIRQVRWSLPVAPCDRCSSPAQRAWETTRTGVDVHLDHPVLLQIIVSVHFCPSCHHHFRVQPPFLRPDATYTNRVVAKAVSSVYRDGMPFSRVAQRLSQDFWVQPSERMIRLWCRQYTDTLTLDGDYQQWVVQEFSGILCVDEVYQDKLALLLAVDPASPKGDRLVGYQLVHGEIQQADVESFLQRLRQAGIKPDEIITDSSPLYPSVLRMVWPAAAHQLCLFHETRLVVACVQQVIREVQDGLPKPPAMQRPKGRFRKDPPAVTEGADQVRYERRSRVALVWQLHRQGYSQRAIARRTGHSRVTIGRWLQEQPPTTLEGTEQSDLSAKPKARPKVGAIEEATAKPCPDVPATADADRLGDWRERPPEPLPLAPWQNWDQVRAYKHDLQAARFLLLRRPDHLSSEQVAEVQAVLAGPVSEPLRVARAFLEEWYQIARDAEGLRRTPAEARECWWAWRQNPGYHSLVPLHRVLLRMDEQRATRVLAFLQRASWEATNNGAERGARQFRHLQAACFRLRTEVAIEGVVKAHALQTREACTKAWPEAGRSARGRHAARKQAEAVAA